MKILRSASLFLVMFLLFGVNIEASTPKVTVSESGEVQVSNVGNNVVGLELTLELSTGSFQSTAFIPLSNSSYTFEKVSGNKITIYSTGKEDLSDNGIVVLGTINTSGNVTFAEGARVDIVNESLIQSVYVKTPVVNELVFNSSNDSSGDSLGDSSDGQVNDTLEDYSSNNSVNQGVSSTGGSNSSANDTTLNAPGNEEGSTDEEILDDEGIEEDAESEGENDELNTPQNDVSTDDGDANSYTGSRGLNNNWLFLLLLVLVGGGVIFYINKPQRKNLTIRTDESMSPVGVIPDRKNGSLKVDRRDRDINIILAEKQEESKDAQYKEW